VSDLLLYAVIITIEPLPIIAFILVLSTDGGARNGAGFIAGWVACLLVMIFGTIAITGGEPLKPPGRGVDIAATALGLGLIGYGLYRQRHRTPADADRPPPSWTKRLDQLGVGGAALLGVLLQPWAFVAAGASSISKADTSTAGSIVLLVLFCLIATASLLIMEIYTVVDREASRAKLDALRSWLDRHREQGIVILAVVIGAWIAVKSIISLLGS
jgi:fructose-specific phosphotransferase system IIC component